jgi:hypothetical protein
MIVAVALIAGLSACVGSETGGDSSARNDDQDAIRTRTRENAGVGSVYLDTVAPLDYQVFEIVPDEDEPKLTYRLMALQSGTPEAMTKTVRLALDSLQRADTTLVAVRAILYTFHPTTRREGKLLPVVWGEWIPPDGWEAAGTSERRRIHRSYVYAVNPGWERAAAVEDE